MSLLEAHLRYLILQLHSEYWTRMLMMPLLSCRSFGFRAALFLEFLEKVRHFFVRLLYIQATKWQDDVQEVSSKLPCPN